MYVRFLAFSVVFLLAFSVLVSPAAAEVSVSVAEEGEALLIEVTDDGEPAEGANVTIEGVGDETALDGEYVTDSEGEVYFGSERTANLSGVIYLRITAEHNDSLRSTLSSLTRGADVEDSGYGARLSQTFTESAGETRGDVSGFFTVRDTQRPIGDDRRAELLADEIDDDIDGLDDARFELQVVGNRFATGDIDEETFLVDYLRYAAAVAAMESDLERTALALDEVDVSARERTGVDEEALDDLLRAIEEGEDVDPGIDIR
ncbi:MAG: hypothetical protein ACLFMT_03220 [Halobacteriales archaeon]